MFEFPVRHGTAAFHTGSKLFAYSFPFGLAPWCFLPTGNCSPIVSCPTWLHSVSYRQETVREGFPIQLGSMVLLAHRKLFAKGFPFGLTPWCSLPTGNCSRKVSYCGAAHWCFLSAGNDSRRVSYCGAAHWCFLPAGNCSHKVSCWSDTQWCFMTTGNYWRMVSY